MREHRRVLPVLMMVVAGGLWAAHGATAGTNQWTRVGPLGSAVTRLVRASDSSDIWAATETGGLYTSNDEGTTWSRVSGIDSNAVLQMEQSAQDASKWLATAPGGVFLRQSGQWSRVLGMAEAEQFHDGCFGHDGSTVFAGTTMGLYRSTNLGQSWTRITSGFGATGLYSVARDPLTSNEVWVGGREGVFKSTDNGVTFTAKMTGLGGLAHSIISRVACSTWDPSLMWVGTWYGLYESADNGESWQRAGSIPEEVVRMLSVGPAAVGIPPLPPLGPGSVVALTPSAAYVRSALTGTWSQLRSGNFSSAQVGSSSWLLGAPDGAIEKSIDVGVSWSALSGKPGYPSVISLAFDGQNGYGIFDFGSHAPHRLYKSSDGGATWVETGPFPPGYEAMVVAAEPSGAVLVGSSEDSVRGILRSADAGATWAHIAPPGAVFGVTLRTYFLAVSPAPATFAAIGVLPGETSGYATQVYTSPLPNASWTGVTPSASGWPSIWATALAVRGQAEVWMGGLTGHTSPVVLKSTNAGTSWAQVGQGVVTGAIRAIALDTQAGQSAVWMAVQGQGVLKTPDLGQSFIVQNTGLPDLAVGSLVKASASNTLYCATDSGGLMRSTNGGTAWSAFAPPAPFVRADELACSPDGNTLLVGASADGLWHYRVSP